MNTYAISALINTVITSAIGLFVYNKNKAKTVNKTFSLFCLFTALWSYSYFFWQIAVNSLTALFYSRCLMAFNSGDSYHNY